MKYQNATDTELRKLVEAYFMEVARLDERESKRAVIRARQALSTVAKLCVKKRAELSDTYQLNSVSKEK